MKVAMLLSGGVDSTYCVYLLQQQGYEVEGFYLKLHDEEKKHEENIRSIDNIAKQMHIKTHVIDARELFKKEVYDYFLSSYKQGLTPNPCALCNPRLKFGFAFSHIMELGFDAMATGHYARIENGYIKEAFDKSKDQSYFLFGLQKDIIQKLIFPLGEMQKVDIKAKAFEALPWFGIADEYKDSQEICFVNTTYIDVLKEHFEVEHSGEIQDTSGNIIGKHKGYMQYTIGKRRGLDIPLAQEPHFVLDIDPTTNTIIAGTQKELAVLEIKAVNFYLDDNFTDGNYFIKARYRGQKIKAFVSKHDNEIKAVLSEPIFGVAKGQALVVYDNDVVLGGGWIV